MSPSFNSTGPLIAQALNSWVLQTLMVFIGNRSVGSISRGLHCGLLHVAVFILTLIYFNFIYVGLTSRLMPFLHMCVHGICLVLSLHRKV